MRIALRRLAGIVIALLALSLLSVVLLIAALNVPQVQQALERLLPSLSGGELALEGLSGQFPGSLRAERLEVSDPRGVWLVIENLTLRWSPTQLFGGWIAIDRLTSDRVKVERLPDYPPDPEETGWDTVLPIRLEEFRVARLDLAREITGRAASLEVNGSGDFTSLQQTASHWTLQRRDAEGTYRAGVALEPQRWRIDLGIEEPAGGLLARWSGLPDLERWSLRGQLDGPPSAADTRLAIAAGAFRADIRGLLDFEKERLDLTVDASSPAMQWRAGHSWRAAALSGWIRGPYRKPEARGSLRIDEVQAGTFGFDGIAADLTGDADGNLSIKARLERPRVPGLKPDLFAASPAVLDVEAQLGSVGTPFTFDLAHPLLRAKGQAKDEDGALRGSASVTVPVIAPFMGLAGVEAQGSLELALRAAHQGGNTSLESLGTLHLAGGDARVLAMLGDKTTFDLATTLNGAELVLSRLQLNGKRLTVSANGRYSPSSGDFNWKASLAELGSIVPELAGSLAAEGRLTGPMQNLVLTASVSGDVSSRQLAGGPLRGEIVLRGLPGAAAGSLKLRAMLAGSTIEAVTNLAQLSSGDLNVVLEQAKWKSTRANGLWTLPRDANWPVGALELHTGSLEDLAPMIGMSLGGPASARLSTSQRGRDREAGLSFSGTTLSIDRLQIATLRTTANFVDDGRRARVDGALSLDDYRVGQVSGTARVEFEGPVDRLQMKASVAATGVGNLPIAVNSSGTLDFPASRLELNGLQIKGLKDPFNLVSPAQIRFSDGVSVDSLQGKLRNAELQLRGRLSPTLDLDARIRRLPVELAAPFLPELAGAKGVLDAECRLAGPYDLPSGKIDMALSAFQVQRDFGKGMPPATMTVSADIEDGAAQVDAQLRAGPLAALAARGKIPLREGGTLDTRWNGSLDLKLFDGWLTPQGQRARGLLTSNARVSGTMSEPRIDGEIQLAKGDFQHFPLGLRIGDIAALARFDGDILRLTRFDGKVAPGGVTATGTWVLRRPDYPFELTVKARNARPLSSERLSVTLNSDLEVRGKIPRAIEARGTIHLHRAEIRIPERMPARIAVLDVRKPGAPTPPPPPPATELDLNVTIDAPREIFVRGRGLDAELGGKVTLRGSAANPEPTGSFKMRRGDFKLAGKTLTFSKGEVGFDGGTLTDPALDFIASSSSANVLATLAVTGTASKPKISLSSVPDLPQDEVLSQLLFGRNAASLGPLELAEIASALAALSGVTGGISNPLELVRKGLGLDRLSMGSDKAGPTLEAGRYVAPGIYLGAKQGFTGATPSAAVQIDVTQNLKVEGTVGTGSPAATQNGTTSVGVIYQYEY